VVFVSPLFIDNFSLSSKTTGKMLNNKEDSHTSNSNSKTEMVLQLKHPVVGIRREVRGAF
jgi:hypothetical protein